MGLLDELKGIVIDQQRAIRERDAKIGTLQQQYDTLNASYWTVLQRLRSYDHIFSLLTNQIRTGNGSDENAAVVDSIAKNTDNPIEQVETVEDGVKAESSAVLNGSVAATVSALTNPLASTIPNGGFKFENGTGKPSTFESNDISSAISSFALDRFAGVSMMNMNGIENGFSDKKGGKCKSVVSRNPTPNGNGAVMTVKVDGTNKPYTCKVCGRRFTDRSNCIKHQFIHTGLKPFECPHCGKRFRRKDHLNSHSKSQHGEEAFPPGVPAPRLSIVAATQALPNVIGNMTDDSSTVSTVTALALDANNTDHDIGDKLNEPIAKKMKIENDNDPEDDRLVIEEIDWASGESKIEEISDDQPIEDPLKIEPTEVEEKTQNTLSKELYERIMNE